MAVNDPRALMSKGDHWAQHPSQLTSLSQAGDLSSCALVVQLEGLPYDYAFNDADLVELFSRYGHLKTVQLLDSNLAPDVALIEFQQINEAQAAASHLNGTVIPLEGQQVVIRVCNFDEDVDKHLQSKLQVSAAAALQGAGPEGATDPFARASQSMSSRTPPGAGASTGGKWCCRFVIGAEAMHRDFPIVGRIIGPQGEHMKTVHDKTGAKLRLRGQRSNYREGPDNRESSDPMHLCVSSNDEITYRRACEMVEALMAGVYRDYGAWCAQRALPVSPIQLICVEGATTDPLEWKLAEFYAAAEGRTPPPRPAEGPAPTAAWTEMPGRKVCRHFQSGSCSYGDRCNFLHIN